MLSSCRARLRSSLVLALLACAMADSTRAQTPSFPPVPAIDSASPVPTVLRRPKIGLVLSGGGARGAAHVGVLKVLEELRVPVDYIAGTSMGSIVGASYASGMSVAEMEKAIALITTQRLFNDSPPRSDDPIRVKADQYRPLASPEFGFSAGGLALPKGLISGVALEGELRDLVKVRGFRHFDELPIPFRAIATNLGNGQMFVFDQGELPTAMRASMAVPGLVAPLNFNGMLLVDGGLVRNLPVDIARNMGADIIIAVNLGTPLLKPEQITGLFGVSMQMLNILTEQNVGQSLAQLHLDDVLIIPELGDFSAGDFDNLVKTIPIGEAAARKVAEKLRRYSLPPTEYAALRARQSIALPPAQPVLQAIVIEGNKRINSEVIRSTIRSEIGKPLNQDMVELDMRRIYGRGDFESVRPDVRVIDGKDTLVVNVTEKSWGPDYARFGLTLEADLGKQSRFDLLASFRFTGLNAYGGEWRNDIVLGNNILLETSFYQPLSERQYFFVEPRLGYSNRPFDLYVGSQKVSEYRDQLYFVGFDLGANILDYAEARIGIYYGRRDFSLESGSLELPQVLNFGVGGLRASATIDQLDSISFTRSGYLLSANAYVSRKDLGASDNYDKVEAQGRTAFAFGRHAFQFAVRGGGSIGADVLPGYAAFQLGGFLNMSGYAQGQLLGPRYTYGRVSYQARLIEFPLFEGLYTGLAFEAARMPQLLAINDTQVFKSATLYGAVDTPIGVLYLGYGYADGDNSSIYLYLGKPF